MPQNSSIDQLLLNLTNDLQKNINGKQLYKDIVNLPFVDKINMVKIDLGIIVLLLVNKETNTIDRVALSRTDIANLTLQVTTKPFKKIKIPLGHRINAIARAIETNTLQQVSDWHYLFVPELSAKAARLNQSNAGIECSFVMPLMALDGGALIFSFFQPPDHIGDEHIKFIKSYALLVEKILSKSRILSSST
jgi:hypothetical protein